MENLNEIQTIIVEQLLQRSEKMKDLARLVILRNIENITSQSKAERIVRKEIENIRLNKEIIFDGQKLYICGTNDGYSIASKDSKEFKAFAKRQMKRYDTCGSILESMKLFCQ